MPKYSTIQIGEPPKLSEGEGNESASSGKDFILKVKRPQEIPCPKPEKIIDEWLKPGWQQIQSEPEQIPARNFINADGTLLWEHPNGQIHHPLLLQGVQVEFKPSIPEFTIRETEHPPELYAALLRSCGVDGAGLQDCRERLKENGYHPLAGEETRGFIRHVVQRFWKDGEFLETEHAERHTTGPCIYRSPIIFLGARNQGFVEAIEAFLEAVPKMETLPEALVRLVGFETLTDTTVSTTLDQSEAASKSKSIYDKDLLLTHPANPEQERVIRRLDAVGSVLVQGTPGTGKSHTIANLVGHLLAQNKTVLISSHTSKALRVVRDKVVKPIQPLCVSVLDSDEESRNQLKENISGIVNYYSVNDPDKLASEILDLGSRREELKKRQQNQIQALTSAMREEYTDIIIAGEGIPPSQAARKLVDYAGKYDWIPGPVIEGAVLPLSITELEELYATNQGIQPDAERILASPIPDMDKLPNVEGFARLVDELTFLEGTISNTDDLFWNNRQQALKGWLGIQTKIGAGTGKRVPRLRAEARELLRKCQDAVPVWIMPFSRVIENFDIAKNKFDVVILDESSQSDVLGLVAFAMGKEVVVVGDDEQVSPYAVGQDVIAIQALIDEMLKDIPNKQLYDGKTSIYDLAGHCFGGTIRLVEHFRCAPDIIQFSNSLCYNGEIKPLREAADTKVYPHLIAYRISDGVSNNKLNEKEAIVTASLVTAMCEQPEYKGLSIGVISLVGTDQSLCIDSILRQRLSPDEYLRRKLVCGNASQFQGDERDVMLISVVDSTGEGPLPLRQSDVYRKIFNVAASRARDQFWVIHSLNPDTDLKDGDLRLRLIKHAEDPSALRRQFETGEGRTDSEFERLVFRDLSNCGYRVVCQWEVGANHIDMVVIGKGDKKVAIECDGDRFHPPDKLAEDMGRQMVLERLGWRFIRIRGSAYFRDPKGAMNRVVRRLEDLGIEPIGAEAAENENPERSTELKDRVIRRSEEIRKHWEENPILQDKADRKTATCS